MVLETTEYNAKLTGMIVKWYFFEMPLAILQNTFEYMKSFSFIFSFIFLLKTFVSPWKNQLYAYPSKGLDIQKILEAFVSNVISRLVGMTMRFVVIVVGLFVEMVIFVGGSLLFVIWIGSPIFFVVSIIGSF